LVNRPKSQLDDRRKLHLLDFYDNWPQARIIDAMDFLTQKFSDLGVKRSTVHNFLKTECNLSFKKLTTQLAARNSPTKIQDCKNWVIKWGATDMDCLKNCAFVDESGFNINMRPPSGWALKGKPAAAETPTGRAVSHTVLGAITTKFVVSMELRNPQKSSKRIKIDFSNRKRKSPAQKKKTTSKGTVTGHHMKFLEKAMDELDCFPELKGCYIVMDNAPIHTTDQIDEMIVARGYRGI
jgi:hypothetical protein